METSIHLRRVIQEMRAEINRLEKENHALRVKLTSISQTASSSGRKSEGEREEAVCDQSSGSLPGDRPMNSAPVVQEYQGNVMIVRRYAVSPSVHSYAANDPWEAKNRLPNNGTSLACSSTRKQDSEEKRLAADACGSHSSSQRASSDDNFVCREKTKTVSFQLPRDRSSVPKNSHPLKNSTNESTDPLSLIAEKGV
ncbi:putative coiled-coil domain-containing protein 195 [Rattus norvegicus]|uniref:Coiled-coil domain containing 195 n=1 Tax=Rattus norvegicus TaxID=10116 RepID=A0A8I5ZUA2_RAT